MPFSASAGFAAMTDGLKEVIKIGDKINKINSSFFITVVVKIVGSFS
jgi:hypothetical protein